MNKIIIDKSIVYNDNNNKDIYVNDNEIVFKKSGTYEIIYENSDDRSLIFVIDGVDIILMESSFDNDIKLSNKYIVNNGNLVVNKFYNNKSVNEDILISLNNEGSKVDYNFANICRGVENYKIDIIHGSKNTISNINNKSVALKNSKITFDINSVVGENEIGSFLNQNTRIVTLGDSEAKINPNMFIDCDDVEARHGSVIGTFKEEQVFYLMSKGISYNDAMKLLIKGYLLSNISVSVDVRLKIMEIIDTYWR